MPMISCNLMIWGVPRAPKHAAGCSILPHCQLLAHSCLERNYELVLKNFRELCIIELSVGFALQAMTGVEYRSLDQTPQSRSPSKRPVRDIWLLRLKLLESVFEVFGSKLYVTLSEQKYLTGR